MLVTGTAGAPLPGGSSGNLCLRHPCLDAVLVWRGTVSYMGHASVMVSVGSVRQQLQSVPPGSFVTRADFFGSPRGIRSSLSRLADAGELLRVRRGLYWKGTSTRFGMTRPSALQVGLRVAGSGSGPAGVAAAHMLGFTTQVPGTVEIAVPGRVPVPFDGVRFRARPVSRRLHGLGPLEVAVLEILRDPAAVEVAWREVVEGVSGLARREEIRPAVMRLAASSESVPAVCALLQGLALP